MLVISPLRSATPTSPASSLNLAKSRAQRSSWTAIQVAAKVSGFVEIEDDGVAANAVEQLNGKEVNGRPLRVNEARPREPRPRRF